MNELNKHTYLHRAGRTVVPTIGDFEKQVKPVSEEFHIPTFAPLANIPHIHLGFANSTLKSRPQIQANAGYSLHPLTALPIGS